MKDREVVAAVVAGDRSGLAEAYDRYAVPLYAYCRSLLPEPADAADAVQDTFVTAACKLGGLRDPGKLRAWLYAVARNECLRRLRAGNVTSALDEAADVAVDHADAGRAAERAGLRELLQAAIDGLNPRERDIVELSLGHGLGGDDIAAVLGVSRNHAHALLSRARGQLERSLGALIVARTGRQACPALAAMLTGWDGRMTVLMRKRISRHVERCDVCGEVKRREFTPELFALGPPLVALLPGFRDQVLGACAGHTPAALAHRASVLGHAGRFGPAGFPRPASSPGAPPWHWAVPHSHAVAAGAATSATAAVVVAVVVVGGGAHHGRPATGPGGAARPTGIAGAGGGSPSPGARRPGGGTPMAPSAPAVATAPGAVTVPGVVTAPGAVTASGPPAGPAGPPGAPGATGTSPAAGPSVPASPPASDGRGEGTLTVSPDTVNLTPSGGTATGTLTLTASGGPVRHYQVTVRSAHELAVSPSSGSLAAGQSVTVTVTDTSRAPLSTWIIVNPGGNKVTVQITG